MVPEENVPMVANIEEDFGIMRDKIIHFGVPLLIFIIIGFASHYVPKPACH